MSADPQQLWDDYEDTLYSVFHRVDLPECSSLTVEWLEDLNPDTNTQSFIVATDRNEREGRNYLRLGTVNFDTGDAEIIKLFPHNGAVCTARSLHRFQNIVACINRQISIYNVEEPHNSDPLVVIDYHENDAWALSWSPHEWAKLLSGGEDKKIALWDIHSSPKELKQPLWEWDKAKDKINDVQWHPFMVGCFGAAIENGEFLLADLRMGKPTSLGVLHNNAAMNSFSFSASNTNIFASGDTSGNLLMFDIRNRSRPLHSLVGHTDAINRVHWNPHYDGVLGSASKDCTTILWDIKRIGCEQEPDDWLDSPPELLYKHGAHYGEVSDFSWNPVNLWNLAAVDTAGNLIIWSPERGMLVNPADVANVQDVRDSDIED